MKITILGKNYNFALEGDKAIFAVCVGIAFIFWFFTKMSNEYTADRSVGLEYIMPSKKAFVSLPAEKIKATFKGSGWDLMGDYLFGEAKIVKVDLSEAQSPGLDKSTLLDKISNLSFNKKQLEITKTVPSTIFINFVDEVKKTIPVVLRSEISYANGYFPTTAAQLSPDSITIFGAQVLLDTITEWKTEFVKLSAQKDPLNLKVSLEDKLSRLIRLSNEKVQVALPIEKWTEQKVYPTVRILNAPDSLVQVFPQKIETTFSVPLSRFNALQDDSFILSADLKDIPMNEINNTVPVQIEKSPKGIRGLTISPNSVRFFLLDTTTQTAVKISED